MSTPLSPIRYLGIPQEECLLAEEIDMLKANINEVVFQKRDIIFRQNTPVSHVLYIKSGLVKIYKEGRNRKNFILKIASSGEFIGLMSFFSNSINQFSASAIGLTAIGYVDKNSFNNLIKKNGAFANGVIRSLSEEGLFIFERLIGQSHKQLPGRIADVILYFADTIFRKEEFDFPFTRRELAELAGTTKESFIRTLSEFKNDKIISLEGSKVSIKSMKIIRTLSELG
jgi:CRP-like cAMP-binding protein